ncbi:MAG TPA: hypothetical protein VF630_17665 [Hymenobacter sp.]
MKKRCFLLALTALAASLRPQRCKSWGCFRGQLLHPLALVDTC